MIMDSLASLALATGDPTDHLLDRPPYKRTEHIISQKMSKHILGMAFYQSIIVFIIAFTGHLWIPEETEYPELITPEGTIVNGRLDRGQEPLYSALIEEFGPSRHFTIVFNAFVLLNIFNMIAARKIEDEMNIFGGIFDNMIFIVVWIIIVIGQVAIVQYGGSLVDCADDGLTSTQWMICLGIGVTSLFWNAVLKLIPDSIFPNLGPAGDDDEKAEIDNHNSKVLSTRKDRESSFQRMNRGGNIGDKEKSSSFQRRNKI
jgi:magnesium-transporting ATPase (P-type)